MKRWIAMVLALMLLAGCGGMGLSVKAEAAGAQSRVLARLTSGGSGNTETPAEAESPISGLTRGVINGAVYENASLGIGCSLGEGWTYMSDEEIEEMTGIAYDSIDSEDLVSVLERSQIAWDMYAMGDDGIYMIGIEIEDVGAIYGSVLDESSYVDIAMDLIDGDLESLGLSDGTMEKSSIYLAGEERVAVKIHGTLQGIIDVYQTQACIKVGNYMVMVLLQTLLEDSTEELAGYFYSLSDAPATPAEEPAAPVEEPVDPEPADPEPALIPAAELGEPVTFIDAMGSSGTYAYVDVTGISDWVYDIDGKRYYAAEDGNYLYIVCVDDAQISEMSEQQVYWDREEDTGDPAVYRVTGLMGTVDADVREAFKTCFEISDEDFDYYFGDDYLDATLVARETPVEAPAVPVESPAEPETPVTEPAVPETPAAADAEAAFPLVLVDNEYCTLTVTGIDDTVSGRYKVNMLCANKMEDMTLSFAWNKVSVSGYMINPYWSQKVEPGEEVESQASFYTSSFEDLNIPSVDEIAFTLIVYDANDWMAENLVEDTFAIYPTGLDASSVVYVDQEITEAGLEIVNDDNCVFTILGAEEESWYYAVYYYAENRTDIPLRLTWEDVSLDGYDIDPYWSVTIAPGKRACGNISFDLDNLELCGITEVEEVVFTLTARDDDDFWAGLLEEVDSAYYPTGLDAASVTYPDRPYAEGEVVFVDDDTCTFAIEGTDPEDSWGYAITCYLENKTDMTLRFAWEDVLVNGYEFNPYWSRSVSPGKRAMVVIYLSDSTMEENGIEEVTGIDFTLSVSDEDDWSADDIIHTAFSYTP